MSKNNQNGSVALIKKDELDQVIIRLKKTLSKIVKSAHVIDHITAEFDTLIMSSPDQGEDIVLDREKTTKMIDHIIDSEEGLKDRGYELWRIAKKLSVLMGGGDLD